MQKIDIGGSSILKTISKFIFYKKIVTNICSCFSSSQKHKFNFLYENDKITINLYFLKITRAQLHSLRSRHT